MTKKSFISFRSALLVLTLSSGLTGLASHASAAPMCSQVLESASAPPDFADKSQVFQWLKRLNPQIDHRQIVEKLAESTDAFMFYRSFVANFFDLIQNDPEKMQRLGELLDQTGWMFGDAHPGNFGPVVFDDGDVKLTMNDLDDGGHGPLGLDMIRFLGGVRIFDPKISDDDLQKIMKSYLSGLSGEKGPKSDYVEELVQKAKKAGRVPDETYFDEKAEVLKRPPTGSIEVGAKDRAALIAALEANFPAQKLKVKDLLELVRAKGGSGGLHRYHALVKTDKDEGIDGHFVIIELKEMTDSSMRDFATGKPPSASERVDHGLAVTQGQHRSRFYAETKINGSPYELRPRFEGSISMDLSDLKKSDAKDLILYDAWRLGKLHSHTADDIQAFRQHFTEKVPVIMDISQQIASEFEQMYQSLGTLVKPQNN